MYQCLQYIGFIFQCLVIDYFQKEMRKDVVTNIYVDQVYVAAAWKWINRIIYCIITLSTCTLHKIIVFDSRISWSSTTFVDLFDQSVATQWLYT
jgi:hypothetical protein